MEGYVYILEVKDIVLPVCKIGMTERSPRQRCAEINNASTGDFIWEVAHWVSVDRCRELESLVHSKLAPLRQKRREFFNINADDAYAAVISILESQETIKKLDPHENHLEDHTEPTTERRKGSKPVFRRIDSEYADLLQLFASVLQVKGKPFGQLNTPRFGISDGNRGVQWNLVVHSDTGDIRMGVNLEGSENTGRWLIADFLKSRPDIHLLRSKVEDPEEVHLSLSRDAWQGPARLKIREKYIGGKEFALSELSRQTWYSLVEEALSCLDENRDYHGRRRNQLVTLESDGQALERDVSPHLNLWKTLRLGSEMEDELRSAIAELRPVYDWVVYACHSKP